MLYGKTLNKVNIVTIPRWMVKVMETDGLTLSQLDAELSGVQLARKNGSYTDGNYIADRLRQRFAKLFSKIDVLDYYWANTIMNELLYAPDDSIYNEASASCMYDIYNIATDKVIENGRNNFINTYSNKQLVLPDIVDINSIILNKDENNNTILQLVVTQGTIFIVVDSGFTNFIVYNNYSFKTFIREHLVGVIYKHYSEDVVVNHPLFKVLIRS